MKKHPEYQYLNLLEEILEKGDKQVDADHGTVTYSLFGRQHRYDLAEGFPLLTTKRVYWTGVLHELYWFYAGMTNIKYLVDNKVHIWDDYPYKIYAEKAEKGEVPEMTKEEFIEKIASDEDFAKEHGELPHIYGEMWRAWPDNGRAVDQLQWVVDEIKKDPSAHNTIVTSWNPAHLYAMAAPGKANRFPICHNLYQINIKDGRLCLQLYQRSADIFLGVPFNIASYALLTHILAKATGYEPGEFVHTFGDVHIYENHIDAAREQLTREPKPFPTLTIEGEIKKLEDFTPDMVKVDGYDPHDRIQADLVVSGGYNKKLHDKKG